MSNQKKIVVTIWISSMFLILLLIFLPAKADQYFLSTRIYLNEQKNIQQQTLEKKNILAILKNPDDDQQLLKMLQDRRNTDAKGLMLLFGMMFILFNVMGCLLYIFGMKPLKIILFILAYLLIPVILIIQSYIRISP